MHPTDTAPLQDKERALDWLTAASPVLLMAFYYYRWQVAGLALLAAAGYAAVYALLQWAGLARVTAAPALATGAWSALLLAADTPLWVAAIAGAVAAATAYLPDLAGRWLPRSHPLLHPVLIGYLFVRWVFPAFVRVYTLPVLWAPLEAAEAATRLGPLFAPDAYNLWHLFLGIREAALGEGCIPVLLMAAGYLLLRRRLRVIAPAVMLATVAALSWLIWDAPLPSLLVGTTVLAALLLADRACAPAAYGDQALTGVIAGGLAVLIRAAAGEDGCILAVAGACLLSPLYPPFLRLCRRGAAWLWRAMRRYLPPAAAWLWRTLRHGGVWLWAKTAALFKLIRGFLQDKFAKIKNKG